MANPRRIFTLYIDVENARRMRYDSTVPALYDPDPLTLLLGQQILFQCHLMMSDATTYFLPGAGAVFYSGLDDVYTQAHADIVQVTNADFIAADWASADFANGKICFRMDLTSQDLKDSIASSTSEIYHMGLWMTPLAGTPTPLVEFDITLQNMATDQSSTPTNPGTIYMTQDMMIAYQKRHEDYASIAFQDGKIPFLYNPDDGQWYPIEARTVGGVVVFQPGTGVATP